MTKAIMNPITEMQMSSAGSRASGAKKEQKNKFIIIKYGV